MLENLLSEIFNFGGGRLQKKREKAKQEILSSASDFLNKLKQRDAKVGDLNEMYHKLTVLGQRYSSRYGHDPDIQNTLTDVSYKYTGKMGGMKKD